ncbi:transcriptional regulator CecR, partial [Escherichia sp. TWPC-MK]
LTQDDTVNLSKFISREQLNHVPAGAKDQFTDSCAIRLWLCEQAFGFFGVRTKLLTQDDTVNLSKFISREQLSPTAAYHLVHEQVISPLHSHLTRLIAAWTGCDANDTRMILHTHALIGEILAFRLGKETILLRTGWTAFDEEKTELINQTVTCHIDLILQGLSQRSL